LALWRESVVARRVFVAGRDGVAGGHWRRDMTRDRGIVKADATGVAAVAAAPRPVAARGLGFRRRR
jgi:hypothetical protein